MSLSVAEYDSPRSHLVCDDFLPKADAERLLDRLVRLEPRLSQGLMRHERLGPLKNPTKRNRVVWLKRDPVVSIVRDGLYRSELVDLLARAKCPLFELVGRSELDALQLSAYRDGDYYGWHRDDGENLNLTVLLFVCASPRAFGGGDLVFAHDGEADRRVRFENNRLVVFPANTLHRVTPVRSTSSRFTDSRFSLQCWIRMATPQERARRSKAAARARDAAPYRSRLIAVDEAQLASLFRVAGAGRDAITRRDMGLADACFEIATSNLLFLKDLTFPDWSLRGSAVVERPADDGTLNVTLPMSAGRGRAARLGYRFARSRGKHRVALFLEVNGAERIVLTDLRGAPEAIARGLRTPRGGG